MDLRLQAGKNFWRKIALNISSCFLKFFYSKDVVAVKTPTNSEIKVSVLHKTGIKIILVFLLLIVYKLLYSCIIPIPQKFQNVPMNLGSTYLVRSGHMGDHEVNYGRNIKFICVNMHSWSYGVRRV